MSTTNLRAKFFTIVVGVDYSELGDRALEHAIATARSHERVRLHVIHVLGGPMGGPQLGVAVEPSFTRESDRLREHVQRTLAEQLLRDGKPPFECLTTHVGLYQPAQSITQLATEIEADLVVVGTHGRRGVKRLLLGSVAEATVRLAPCPVLVVRPVGLTGAVPIPEIEPPCPRCLDALEASDGVQLWCAQHRELHARAHTYRIGGQRPSHQSGLLVPF